MNALAERIVAALPTARDEVLVRDRCGRGPLVEAVVAACRRRGLRPIEEAASNEVLRAAIASTSPETLSTWDVERLPIADRVSGLIVLGGWPINLDGLPAASVAAWASAVSSVERRLESRRVPSVFVAVPTEQLATSLGWGFRDLDEFVASTILASSAELAGPIDALVDAHRAATAISISTAAGIAHFDRGDRSILVDDGVIDEADIAAGAVVSNLPAGSVYWTVLEPSTRGSISLVGGDVLRFDESGRVVEGALAGERVSHVGIATNVRVGEPIGWTIVDEHCPGAVFLALGENRYMGGQNESTTNVDLLVDSPTVRIGSSMVVDRGRLCA